MGTEAGQLGPVAALNTAAWILVVCPGVVHCRYCTSAMADQSQRGSISGLSEAALAKLGTLADVPALL